MQDRAQQRAGVAETGAGRPRTASPAPGGAAGVLALQRAAGNRATTAAIVGRGGLVQRRMEFDASSLGSSSLKEKVGAVFGGEDTWKKIKDALTEYRGTYEAGKQLALLKAMLALVIKWMDGNKKVKSTSSGRAQQLAKLGEAIHLEMPNAERQASYLADVKDPGKKNAAGKREKKFKYLSAMGALTAESASDIAGQKTNPDQFEIMKKYDLSDAELAAIKIYTIDDYRYINPALAGNDAWLASQVPKIQGIQSPDTSPAGLKQATREGRRHGEMAMEGLKKLDAWKEAPTYRGLRLSPADFKKQFQDTNQFSTKAFLSTSKAKDVSEGFAKMKTGEPAGEGGGGWRKEAEASADGLVGILITYEVTNGRDISKISMIGSENEILLLPGATFTISEVKPRAGQPAEDPMYDVTMKQTS